MTRLLLIPFHFSLLSLALLAVMASPHRKKTAQILEFKKRVA